MEENLEKNKNEDFKSLKEEPKEKMISLNEIAESIYTKVYEEVSKNFNEVLKTINTNLGNVAYRLFSIELILYKFIKEGKIDKEILGEIILQENIVISNVEIMLKRIEEVKLKNEEALVNIDKKSKDDDKKIDKNDDKSGEIKKEEVKK